MKQGRLSRKSERRRDQVEEALFELSGVLTDLDEVILRNRQAIRRTALVKDVLDPAVTRLAQIHRNVRKASKQLNDLWTEEQERRWQKME